MAISTFGTVIVLTIILICVSIFLHFIFPNSFTCSFLKAPERYTAEIGKFADGNYKKSSKLISGNHLTTSIQHSGYPQPRTLRNLLNKDECQYIIEMAKPKLYRSKVMGENSHEISKVRTSKNTFLLKTDPVVNELMNRISLITGYPAENFEDLQVVNYGPTQEYKPHYDACATNTESCKKDYHEHGGYRIWTVFIYLNDGFDGGETIFPNLDKKVKLPPGDGVLFYNINDERTGTPHEALHGGAPVTRGEKWGCNVWIREGVF